MKLTTMTQVSVDGVVQGNGGASDEDRRNGFERFGRRTYELFAGYWGVMDPGSGSIADALNTKPTYVASTTLTDPKWADTAVLSGDPRRPSAS